MINQMYLNANDDLAPVKVEWSEDLEDYKLNIPDGITRVDLVQLVEELKYLTRMDD